MKFISIGFGNAVAAARNKGGLTEETLKRIEEAAGLL